MTVGNASFSTVTGNTQCVICHDQWTTSFDMTNTNTSYEKKKLGMLLLA